MSTISKFASVLKTGNQAPTDKLVGQLISQMRGQAALIRPDVAKSAMSLEGFNDAQYVEVNDAATKLRNMLSSAGLKQLERGKSAKDFDKDNVYSYAQESAALAAAAIASAPADWLATGRIAYEDLKQYGGIRKGEATQVIGMLDQLNSQERIAAEAYDERNNRDIVGFSVAYNLQASRQGEFAEMFFPTTVIAPDQVGFNVQIRILYKYSEVVRTPAGTPDAFLRRNLIRAIIDATILAADQTHVIPVYRLSNPAAATDNSQYFVAGITPVSVTYDNQTFLTAPYAVGKTFSLLGLSQTNAELALGAQNQTDALDSSIRLSKVYFTLTGTVAGNAVTEYFGVDVSKFPTSDFNAAPQGNTRKLQLNFDSSAILVNGSLLTVAGAASQLLPTPMGTSSARLRFQLSGSVIQDVADCTVTPFPVQVSAVNDSTGAIIPTPSSPITTLLGTATIVGYDLIAYRTNSNRRDRGVLLDIQRINYLYTVPILPPISALRPVTSSDAQDGQLLSDLVTSTRVQAANRGVTALLDAVSFMAAQANSPDMIVNQPTLFGAASNLIVGQYAAATLDISASLDSLKDSDRLSDLLALLYNKIRDMALGLYIKSGYGPAAEYMYEGRAPKTIIMIGTDPYIGRYLQLLVADQKLLGGDQFEYRVAISWDSRMAGQLIFSFGQADAFESGQPNPLHFGSFAYRSELTVMMPMVRGNSQSMELTVQPSYRHVVHLPIIGVLTVLNLPNINTKVAINMRTVS